MIRERRGFSLIELLIVCAIIVVLAGLLIPAVARLRRAADITVNQNNMRQIILAAHGFATQYEKLPSPPRCVAADGDGNCLEYTYTGPPDGGPFHNQILPYTEYSSYYNKTEGTIKMYVARGDPTPKPNAAPVCFPFLAIDSETGGPVAGPLETHATSLQAYITQGYSLDRSWSSAVGRGNASAAPSPATKSYVVKVWTGVKWTSNSFWQLQQNPGVPGSFLDPLYQTYMVTAPPYGDKCSIYINWTTPADPHHKEFWYNVRYKQWSPPFQDVPPVKEANSSFSQSLFTNALDLGMLDGSIRRVSGDVSKEAWNAMMQGQNVPPGQ